MADNPLRTYFRRPAIYIKLPSNGNFYSQSSLQLPSNGEIPVFPMTAVDEISYRTPDALFNGQATVDVIESCVPSIKNAWDIPSTDLDTILIAIRIASYGHSMDIDTTCPNCNEESTYGVDLRSILESLSTPDFNSGLTVGDLTVFFKPLNYRQISENNIIRFEEQKLMNVLIDSDMEEDEKVKILADAFKKVTELTVKAVTQGIAYIKTPETIVNDPNYINEFLHNCENKVFDRLKDHIVDLKTSSELKPLNVKCTHCNHEYQQPFTLDMTNFFEQES